MQGHAGLQGHADQLLGHNQAQPGSCPLRVLPAHSPPSCQPWTQPCHTPSRSRPPRLTWPPLVHCARPSVSVDCHNWHAGSPLRMCLCACLNPQPRAPGAAAHDMLCAESCKDTLVTYALVCRAPGGAAAAVRCAMALARAKAAHPSGCAADPGTTLSRWAWAMCCRAQAMPAQSWVSMGQLPRRSAV